MKSVNGRKAHRDQPPPPLLLLLLLLLALHALNQAWRLSLLWFACGCDYEPLSSTLAVLTSKMCFFLRLRVVRHAFFLPLHPTQHHLFQCGTEPGCPDFCGTFLFGIYLLFPTYWRQGGKMSPCLWRCLQKNKQNKNNNTRSSFHPFTLASSFFFLYSLAPPHLSLHPFIPSSFHPFIPSPPCPLNMRCLSQTATLMLAVVVVALAVMLAPGCMGQQGSSDATEPEQIHIALAGRDAEGNSNGMAISWQTQVATNTSVVKYGLSKSALTHTATGRCSSYYATYDHHVILHNLTLNTRYYYQVGDAQGGWSEIFSFKSAPKSSPEMPIDFAVWGDLGVVDGDSTISFLEAIQDDIDLMVSVCCVCCQCCQ